MRPIELKIAGLQSYREQQVIDFTALTDTGVFGIFGPTGSGKSTILDAITLALYARVERASNGTQGIMNQAEDVLSVSFTFALHAAAGTEFYRVDRQFKRNNEVSISHAYSRLIQMQSHDEQVLADKLGDVNSYVQQLLGLSVDDFTRAVVLPQGKFAEFLYLKGSDRRQMLQRLFNLERYGNELLKRLAQQSKANEIQLKEISAEQQGLGEASDEALKQAEQTLQEAQQQVHDSRLHLEQQEALMKEHQQIWEWQEQRKKIEQLLQHLNEEVPLMNRLEAQLREAEQADMLRPVLEKWLADQERLVTSKERYEQAQQMDNVAKQQYAEAESAHDEAAKRREAEEVPLKLQLNNYHQALQLENELLPLQQSLAELVETYNQLNEAQRQLQEQLKQKTEQLDQAKNEQSERQKSWSDIAISPAEMRKVQRAHYEYEKITSYEEEHRADLQKMTETEARLTQAQTEVIELRQSQQAAQEQLQTIALNLHHAIDELVQQQSKLTQFEQDIPLILDKLKDDLEQQQLVRQAGMLAQGLTSGQPCPVCGATDHPQPAEKVHDQLEIDRLINRWQALLATVREQQLVCNRLNFTLDHQLKQIEQLSDAPLAQAHIAEAAAAMGRVDMAEAASTMTWAEMAEATSTTMDSLLIGSPIERNEDIHRGDDMLQQAEAQLQQISFKIEKLETASNSHDDMMTSLLKQYREVDAQLIKRTAEIEAEQTSYDELQRHVYDLAERIKQQRLAWEHEYPEWEFTQIKEQHMQLQEREQQAEAIQSKLKEEEQQISSYTKELEHLRTRLHEQDIAIVQTKGQLEQVEQQIKEKAKMLQQWVGEASAAQLIEETTAHLEQLIEAEEQSKQRREEARRQLERTGQERSAAEQAWRSASEHAAQSEQAWHLQLAKSPFTSVEQVKKAFLPETDAGHIRSRIQAHHEQLQLNRHQLHELEAELENRTLTSVQWEAIQAHLNQAKVDYEQGLAAVAKAERDYEDIQQRHTRWLELEQEAGVAKQMAEQLGLLQQVLRGNALVEFIAEEQLIQVSRAASERLGNLTGQRYAIEVDSSGGFQIRDHANGGVKRPASTLSGGEAFLTSLALALALSAQIQLGGRYPLEFFFLDEGFGTLDQEMLDHVITALEKLHHDQLVVGVISHVPELRTRLPRRLIVHPAEPSGRGSTVAMESM